MQTEFRQWPGPRAPAAAMAAATACLVLLAGCAGLSSPPPEPQAGTPTEIAEPAAAPAQPEAPPIDAGAVTPPQVPPPAPPPPVAPAAAPVAAALEHADRVRSLNGPELTAEITRLNAMGAAPLRQLQLAQALLQTHQSSEYGRIQQLLQSVLANDGEEARQLHPLARLLAAHQAQLRRLEEQNDRQAQLVREGQKRIDQLSERLEALRAIERSMPTRPAR